MGQKALSILMCTVKQRAAQFNLLYRHINSQLTPQVEVLYQLDNKEISVGEKRQQLLNKAQGDYVVYVDDDDWVPPYYVEEILKAIETKPDCIGFYISCNIKGIKKSAIASLRYNKWLDNIDGFDYVRSIYHKTPVKREIAFKAGFPDIRMGEDAVYSEKLQPFLKTEAFIKRVMYFYIYRSEGSIKQRYGF